jgi:hypothetical protein
MATHNRLKAHADLADLRLDDLFLGTEIAVSGLEVAVGDIGLWEDPFTISFPTSKGNLIEISRPISEVEKIIETQILQKQYEKSLVFAVAEAEDHVASYLRILLRAYPDRLIRGARGGKSERKVTLEKVIRAGSRESLISSITEDRINSIMHKPSEYLQYLGHIIGRHLSDQVVNRFCELCATRDLIVHAQGKVNSVYMSKAAGLERGKIGDLVVVDEPYFQSSSAI